MPAIRDKSLQSRRMGAALNGLAQSDLEDGLSEYDPYTGQPTGDQNLVRSILDFGSQLLQPKQPAQIVYAQPQAQPSPFGGISTPLLVAAGLAAIFILTMPKGKR
jgi:hypothetical protein